MIVICMLTDVVASIALVLEEPEPDMMLHPPRSLTKDRLVDGKLVLDRGSLVQRQELELHEMEEAEEEGHGFTTSLSFLKRTPAVRWTNAETKDFYTALRTYGLNFTLMAQACC